MAHSGVLIRDFVHREREFKVGTRRGEDGYWRWFHVGVQVPDPALVEPCLSPEASLEQAKAIARLRIDMELGPAA